MKGMKKKFMSYAIFMAAAAAAQPDFYTGASRGYAKKMTKQDLPRWNVGGQIIFAKDALQDFEKDDFLRLAKLTKSKTFIIFYLYV